MHSRKLVACTSCSRQFDITHVEPGSAFACECGQELYAVVARNHAPRALRCSNCGGSLRDGARACEYCGAEVTLEERRLDSVCPCCYARMSSSAQFCMECGRKIEPQAVEALAVGLACPRCRGEMSSRSVGTQPLIECARCGGMWVQPGVFDSICRESCSPSAASFDYAPPVMVERPADGHPVVYLPCPMCQDLMVRRNYGGHSSVIIDVCRHHGVWLDHSELERIVQYLRAGGPADRAGVAGRSDASGGEGGQPKQWRPSPRPMTGSLFGSDVRSDGDDDLTRVLRWVGSGLSDLFRI